MDKNFFKKQNSLNIIIVVLVLVVVFLGFSYMGDEENNLDSNLDKKRTDTVFGGGVSGIGSNANAEIRHVDYEEESLKWTNAIRESGAAQAYNNFKQAFAYDHFGTQHSAAHIFGEILFDEEGIEGLSYCDSTFAFGCFHSFFSKALHVLGEGVIGDMDSTCILKYGEFGTGCQHGIGHGILQYTGHKNLVEALELCRFTTQKVPTFGCTSGVFMEYNVPLINYGEDQAFVTRSRVLNPDKPYEPCPGLPYKFKESCYYEMGQWWDKVYDANYEKIGELCENILDQEFRESCYLGVGNVVAPTNLYDVAKTKKDCSLMPRDTGRLNCRSGASWSFFANPDYRDLASQVCDDLDEKTKEKCVQGSRLIENSLKKQ